MVSWRRVETDSSRGTGSGLLTVLAEKLHWQHSESGTSRILQGSHQSVVHSYADSFYSLNVLHVLQLVTIISWGRTRWWHCTTRSIFL